MFNESLKVLVLCSLKKKKCGRRGRKPQFELIIKLKLLQNSVQKIKKHKILNYTLLFFSKQNYFLLLIVLQLLSFYLRQLKFVLIAIKKNFCTFVFLHLPHSFLQIAFCFYNKI